MMQKRKNFLETKLNAASWLVRSIEQRRLTLYRVACCIVEIQREFLLYGVKHLKPLNLKQVAEIVGVHESTVSRATSNKYIQTPQGVFEFKYLFCSGVSDDQGSSFSSQTIKKLIREMVETEDIHAPLSDQKMVDILKQKGVPVSRRTVAKYRTECGIQPAAMRKRY
jgi:RNA polymerase sigma-54 factor